MGLNLKAKKKSTVKAGVYLVTISDVKYARGYNKELKVNNDGDNGLEFRFKNKFGEVIDHTFWLGEKHISDLESLCKIIDIEMGSDVESIKGRKLYIVVASEYLMNGAKKKLDTTGSPVRYSRLVPMFFSAKEAEPKFDDRFLEGYETGIFLIEKQS